MKKVHLIRWSILLIGLLLVRLTMAIPGWGEKYAQQIYPHCQHLLSILSSSFPFSIGDCFIYGSITGLLVVLLLVLFRKLPFWVSIRNIIEYLLWVYFWFYAAWGLNYFRADFYDRSGVSRVTYENDLFCDFLQDYTKALNSSYTSIQPLSSVYIDQQIKNGYHQWTERLGLLNPEKNQLAKSMLFSSLMSKVGVCGYIGPFFNEYHLNRDLLPIEYPFTYAHELSHVLGVSNEAEANLCAYLVCTTADDQQIRFSGYFGILSYVIRNARGLLGKEEYIKWIHSISPEIIHLLQDESEHWQSLYSPFIGKIQDRLYNFYLKGNRISSGTKNYGQVIALLMALKQADSK